MTDLITNEITGGAVPVTIAGRECRLSYPLHAIFLYKKLTGESLFQFDNWNKIDFEENYECWIACLWAGLHELGPDGWSAPYTRQELEPLVGFENGAILHTKMVEALTAWMPKPKKTVAGADESAEAEKKAAPRPLRTLGPQFPQTRPHPRPLPSHLPARARPAV